MSTKVTLSTKTLSPAMVINPGKTSNVHVLITVVLGMLEAAGLKKTSLKLVLLIDRSPSVGNAIPGGFGSILDETKKSCNQVVTQLAKENREEGTRHHVAVIQFDNLCEAKDVLLPVTLCDEEGAALARNAIRSITPRLDGGTAFEPAILRATGEAKKVVEECASLIVHFTDGEDFGSHDGAVKAAEQARAAGITLKLGAIGLSPDNKAHCENIAGANFAALGNADEVQKWFFGAQAQMSQALITNAALRLQPPNYVKLVSLGRGTRKRGANQPDTDFAEGSGNVLDLGAIGEAQTIRCYACLEVTQPMDIQPDAWSLGKAVVTGDIASEGKTGEPLGNTFIEIEFAKKLFGKADEEVVEVMNITNAQRELIAFQRTGDKSRIKAARQTLEFDDSAAAAALKRQFDEIEAEQDPTKASDKAKRATQGFDNTAAADALSNMMK